MNLSVFISHRFPAQGLQVAFEAPEGVTALIGRSGAGKSSVANVLAGLLRADKARVAVEGEVLEDSAQGLWLPPAARRIGYVFQDARLFPHLDVLGNLLYGAKRRGLAAAAQGKLSQVTELLDIDPLLDRRPGALSSARCHWSGASVRPAHVAAG